ncbi:hypothetical protein OG218_00935 [Kineococcus sp. NBC_00420]|uniref:hypothetical protein n=1 Tax=Kineococcus sp. NBC_00420 TaxID=2903564 RepID=UPI002E1EE3B6
MTSTLNGMNRNRHAAVRALLVQQAQATTLQTAPAAGTNSGSHPQRTDEAAVRRPIWRRSKLALTSAGGLLAAGLAVVTIVTVSRPLPAYAVTGGNGKEVKVQVNRLEGAHALEEALGKKGITADITYLPRDKMCQPGRYVAVQARGLLLSVTEDRFEVTIAPGMVDKGQTFVMSASTPTPVKNGFRSSVEFDVAEGPIAPCIPVDAS